MRVGARQLQRNQQALRAASCKLGGQGSLRIQSDEQRFQDPGCTRRSLLQSNLIRKHSEISTNLRFHQQLNPLHIQRVPRTHLAAFNDDFSV